MKLPLILGLILMGGAVLLFCGPMISGGGFPMFMPAIWLGIFGGLLMIGSLFERRSYKKILDAAPDGYIATQERFIDMRTGQPVRIYYQAVTGDRVYVQDRQPA